ncbi:PRC-barrel domain-containing protein [Amorphus sp. 3PC139-8]|uniref:PRC-barrel domain-containing protein n=1 Tax=Amorphus sp. 3PC139-8 TaxID=2735676 RepID=UPI00345D9F90
MKRLLATTALILPMGFGIAFAQEPPTSADQIDGSAVESQPNASTDAADSDTTSSGEQTGLPGESASNTEADSTPIVREQASNELRLDWIMDTTVTSPGGEIIGSINDLIVDRDSGEMQAAILAVGGFLGFGAKQIAVEWSELEIDFDANRISLDLTREEADNAPEYNFREQVSSEPADPADTSVGGTGTSGMGTGTGVGTGVGQGN